MGLLLLRAAISAYSINAGVSALVSQRPAVFPGATEGVLNLAIGALLLAGFLTPIAGFLSVLSRMMDGIRGLSVAFPGNSNPMILYLVLLLISAAVVLLGPGAFSVDAHLFGRREIIIPRRKAALTSIPPE
jgi:hypothetical protein